MLDQLLPVCHTHAHRLKSKYRTGWPKNLRLRVLAADALLHGGPRGNAVNPLEQVRELVELVLLEARDLPALDPRPRLDVGHAVFALALAG